MEKGSKHTAETRAAIGAGVRARFQKQRERSSLVVVAIDDALEAIDRAYEAINEFDYAVVNKHRRDRVERMRREMDEALALAYDAMRTSADLVKKERR